MSDWVSCKSEKPPRGVLCKFRNHAGEWVGYVDELSSLKGLEWMMTGIGREQYEARGFEITRQLDALWD